MAMGANLDFVADRDMGADDRSFADFRIPVNDCIRTNLIRSYAIFAVSWMTAVG